MDVKVKNSEATKVYMKFLGVLRNKCVDERQNGGLFINKRPWVKMNCILRKREKVCGLSGNQRIEQCAGRPTEAVADVKGRGTSHVLSASRMSQLMN